MLQRSVALAIAAVLAQASVARAADGVTLKAEAGLAGICRPGRWTPVRIEIGTNSEDLDASLRVQWGDARVTRQVELSAPSRRLVQLYIRSADPRSTIEVRLQAHGRDLERIEIPVRLAGMDDPLVVCAGGATAAHDSSCSATLADDELPSSWRGYDAATEVRVAAAAVLGTEQRGALRTWRAMRRLEDLGAPATAGGAIPDTRDATHRVRAALISYVLLMVVAAAFWSRPPWPLTAHAAFLCAITLAAVAATATAGRFSPAVVHHASVAQQFEGAPGTLVTMRGVAEFPTRRRFSISAVLDGALDDRGSSAGGNEERFDAAGHPVLEAWTHLGAARSFTLEGVTDFRALEATRAGRLLRVSNVSGRPLADCEWPDGLSGAGPRELPPGASLQTTNPIGGTDPVVSCRFAGAPIDFADSRAPVRTDGATTVVYHLAGAGGDQ